MRATHLAVGLVMIALSACDKQTSENDNIHGLDTVRRELDSQAGRGLFVLEGCVVCHSVNGVGGKAGPALDSEVGAPPIDPLEFAARMWRGAPAMIELQSVELGYTIDLTADDIAHLAAFAADREEQKKLTLESVPLELRESFLDERFWEVEDWDEFLKNGREGYEPTAPVDEEASDRPGNR